MRMTKRQLIQALAELPDDAPIILAKDEEGNGFCYLEAVGIDHRTDTDAAILWPEHDEIPTEDEP